jgi:hypothetical protein
LHDSDDRHEQQRDPEEGTIVMLNLRQMTKVHSENTGNECNWHKDSSDDSELFH